MSPRRESAAFAVAGASLVALFALGAEGRSAPNPTPRVYAHAQHTLGNLLGAPLPPPAPPPLVKGNVETTDPWTGEPAAAVTPWVREHPVELQDPWTGAAFAVTARARGPRSIDLDDPWRSRAQEPRGIDFDNPWR